LTVRASVAKSGKLREIPLDDGMLEVLAALRDAAKDRQPVSGATPKQTAQQAAAFSREHVFVSGANTPLKNNLLRSFYETCKRAGIAGAEPGGSVDIHALRGTFATLMLEGGASPKAVQELLGHSTLALTMTTYAKATERAKRAAISALPYAKATPPAYIVSTDGMRTELATGSNSVAQSAVA
jgi:integrase